MYRDGQRNWLQIRGADMKRLKLFPKTFFYTLVLMVFVVVIAHVLMYLLAPQMGMVSLSPIPTNLQSKLILFSA